MHERRFGVLPTLAAQLRILWIDPAAQTKNWKAAVYARQLRGAKALCRGAVIDDLTGDRGRVETRARFVELIVFCVEVDRRSMMMWWMFVNAASLASAL